MKLDLKKMAALAAAFFPVTAALADFDVAPSVVSGKIVTNAFTDEGASADNNYTPFVQNVRVFDFGFDDPTPPLFTQDPGTHPQPGSGFTAASNLRVGAVSTLSYYSGSGPVSFSAVPGDTFLQLSFGSASSTIGGGSFSPTTFNLGAPDAQGEFDRHLGSSIYSTSTPDSLPADGVYLVELQYTDTGTTAFAASDPVYILYSVNADDGVDAAKEYLRDTFAPGTNLAPLVPEPASLGLVAAPAALLLRRRR